MQYPKHLSSPTSYNSRKKPSTINPHTIIHSIINHSNLSDSSHSNDSNIYSSFTSNDYSHQSSIHQDHKTKDYSQTELLFYPIYSDRALLTNPPPTHTPLLQYPVSYPYLNVNTIINNTTCTLLNLSTYHDDSNESKLYLDHNNLSHSLIPSPSFPSSILSTSSIEHKTHEFNKTQKNIKKTKFQNLDYITLFNTNKVSGCILDFANTAHSTLVSRSIIPHHPYHQMINLLQKLLPPPIRLSRAQNYQ